MSVEYEGVRALDHASLDVGDGEIVALIGANGAGKSTLLKAISRIEPSTADEISFEGTSIAAIGPDEVVMRGLNLVPQGRALFASLSVLDNLLAGRYRVPARRRHRCAAQAARRGSLRDSSSSCKPFTSSFRSSWNDATSWPGR